MVAGATVALAMTLFGASCSTGGADGGSSASGQTTTSDVSQGGATTTGPLGSGGPSPIPDGIRIEVLSSQPDRVTGSDARIRVTPPANTSAATLKVQVDDRDARGSLRVVDGNLEGVVTGLIEGNNTIAAEAGSQRTLQRIRAWPIQGPMISGPHAPLLACATASAGLGAPTDADCSAPPIVTWHYLTTAHRLADLPDRHQAPADLGHATIDGTSVPLYVRVERGVINRSIYELSSIDATPGDDDPTGPGWNGKLRYRFGGDCGTTFGQGTIAAPTDDPAALLEGYAVATASFNDFDVQCNDVLSAETALMVKERFIEEFGVPTFTIGEGTGGGGGAQVHLLAQNYPGVINGAVATNGFPDIFSVWPGATDCGLLDHYYRSTAGRSLTAAQRTAINGHATSKTCTTWQAHLLDALNPTTGCDPAIDRSKIYDPSTNRGGVRCTLQDANRNQLGTDPATKAANRPLDNIGIQYGLQALSDGTITVDQFLDLNAEIGGYDADGAVVADREAADPAVVEHTYEAGRVSKAGGDQRAIPIIDVDPYDDPTGDVHDHFRAFSLRDRLTGYTPVEGTDDATPGFQIWTRPAGAVSAEPAVAVLDEWLTALRADRHGGAMADVLGRTRPSAAADNCLVAGATKPVGGTGIYDRKGPCRDHYPIDGDPRTVAGEPRSDQVLKCALKAIDRSDYDADLSPEQFNRLLATFPQGVCDWSGPSQGEVTPANPDRSYQDVPGPGQDA